MVALKQGTMQKLLLIVTVAGLIAANFPLRETDRNTLKWYAYGKSRWKAAYMQNENIKAADHSANFAIYPVPERTHLKQKLEYFKKEKINLYLDVPSSQINP
jgi:Mg2+/Co2+ transporter CorB